MKKIIFYISMMFTLILTLSSCGGLVGEDSLVITSINYELLDDGRTMVVITYEDEDIEPAIFYLPKGSDGNGIKEVFHKTSEDGKNTIVEVYFTDEDMGMYTFSVPRGVSVSGISTKKDNAGNTLLTVNYDNNTSSEPILIPKGEKGDTGTTLVDYSYTQNEDGSQDIKFIYSDGSTYPIHIPAPQKGEDGKTGISVTGITGFENGNYYYVVFTLSEGEQKTLRFTRPKDANQWYSGSGKPNPDLGVVGDYYFDISYNTIYIKEIDELTEEEFWSTIIDFDDNDEKYTVTFELNDPDGTAYIESGRKEYTITRGEYFTASYDMPTVTKPGYRFVGWCTKKEQTPTSGMFTDLTPVFSNLTLYAIWEKIE